MHNTNVSDVYLTLCALFFFGGTAAVVSGGGWVWAIALWLVALYLFVASVLTWMRRG